MEFLRSIDCISNILNITYVIIIGRSTELKNIRMQANFFYGNFHCTYLVLIIII